MTSARLCDDLAPFGSYLGAVNVKEPKGDAIIAGAFKKVAKSKVAPESVFVQITLEGIKILGALSSEVLAAYPLKNISFSTVTGKQKNVLVCCWVLSICARPSSKLILISILCSIQHQAFTQRDDSLGLINW